MISFLFGWFVKITGSIVYAPLFRTKYYYEDKARQSRRIKGSAIVVSNHGSVWDFAVAMFTFPMRTLRCAVAELMYKKNFLFSFFLRVLGTIKVDRDAHDMLFLTKCERVLSRGGVIEIYPEARIPENYDEKPLEFKVSAVLLALKTGAPIIPICHNYTYFGKGRTRVMIGTPIDVRELYDEELSEKENLTKITNIIRGKIIEFGEQLKKEEK